MNLCGCALNNNKRPYEPIRSIPRKRDDDYGSWQVFWLTPDVLRLPIFLDEKTVAKVLQPSFTEFTAAGLLRILTWFPLQFRTATPHENQDRNIFRCKDRQNFRHCNQKVMNNRKKTDAFYEFSRIVYFKNFVYLCRRIIMPLPSPEPFREGANNWLSVNYKINSKTNEKYENNFETLNSETFSFFIT